ncbi:hypothetical protein ILUMI_23342 [Ignelater luminosus]|uniref:LIM zinc-binding domain-containing protein n=1 Tax=Ignelater luminosus TaxID=2038154 RepID=A0A8K0C8A8_IGNLU|nr:hypothetical protein ILUMI_23342 [Ignelater luminosus]
MAETVKKSRIVSEADENLEESLLEEFNLRLKKCMSRDDLQSEEDIIDTTETHVYENVEIIKSNGATSPIINHQFVQNGIATQEFLENERENYDVNGCNHNITSNGHQENEKSCDEVENFENLEVVDSCNSNLEKIDCEINTIKTDTNLDQSLSETPDIETIDSKPSLNLPTTCLIDASESLDSENLDVKSVKDRMFLSTDDASCLLFTQTVTSPMLTPSEENIDFLKGFRRESSQYTLSDNTNSSNSPKSEPKVEDECVENNIATKTIDSVIDVPSEELPIVTDKPKNEIIYENMEFLREQGYENSKTNETPTAVENSEQPPMEVYENNVVNIKEETSKFIETEIYYTESSNNVENQEVLSDLKDEHATENDNSSIEQIEKKEEIPNELSTNENENSELPDEIPVDNVKQLKSHFMKNESSEPVKSPRIETTDELDELKSLNIMKQISKFENTSDKTEELTTICSNISVSTITESRFVETTTEMHSSGETSLKKKKSKKSKNQHEKENISVKSSFSKFDSLQKKNALNSSSPDQDNLSGGDAMNCKKCGRPVFQMEKIIAERCIYHRNCFRCVECGKQLLVDNFETHEGTLYCKPHFRALFTPKAVEEDTPVKPRKHELIIRENQPAELPPDVARASDKPDLGLEELHSLNVKERFQVFENAKQTTDNQIEKNTVKMERSPSILSKLARFQAKGMNVGVTDDALNGVPVEVSSSEEEEEEEEIEGEDADLVRAKRVQKEKPFHFSQMNDVKSKWEQGNHLQNRDERREERKQEIQNIRSRLFMGKQGKMKEAYQQAILESESASNLKKEVALEASDTRSIKDKFEKGEVANNELRHKENEDMSVFESGISKKSRTIFQELDASGGKAPKVSPTSPPKLGNAVRSGREAYLAKQASEDTVRSSDQVDEITIRTSDIQDRFKFFETYKEPQQKRKEFRMTPPREGQNKSESPEREVYIDPDIVRAEDFIEDSVVAKTTHTATKMLNKFRQMEENLQKGQEPQGPKPLKRFTPPREPIRRESTSEEESGSEESEDEVDNYSRMPERDLLEAQKAARAKQLRAKFERWEESEVEVRRDSNQVNIVEEFGDEQSQIETAKSLRAKFESLKETTNNQRPSSRVKVNRFVDVVSNNSVTCESCRLRVYPLEMITVHGHVFHRNCFRCKECNAVLRMDSYSYNQGLLYCTTHFKRLFISKGNYDTAFGLEQHKEKWNVTTVA